MNEALAIPEDPGYFGELTLTAYVAPPTLTFEQWTEDFNRVGLVTRGIKWIAADLLLVAEERFENQSEQFFDALGYSQHTLENIRWVAKRFPPSRRRETLSFSHYEKVASKKFTDEEQDEWLDQAVDGRWSVDELEAAIKEARGIKETDRVSLVEENPIGEDDLEFEKNESGSIKGLRSKSRGLVVKFLSAKAVGLEVAGHKVQIWSQAAIGITEPKKQEEASA